MTKLLKKLIDSHVTEEKIAQDQGAGLSVMKRTGRVIIDKVVWEAILEELDIINYT